MDADMSMQSHAIAVDLMPSCGVSCVRVSLMDLDLDLCLSIMMPGRQGYKCNSQMMMVALQALRGIQLDRWFCPRAVHGCTCTTIHVQHCTTSTRTPSWRPENQTAAGPCRQHWHPQNNSSYSAHSEHPGHAHRKCLRLTQPPLYPLQGTATCSMPWPVAYPGP